MPLKLISIKNEQRSPSLYSFFERKNIVFQTLLKKVNIQNKKKGFVDVVVI